jgi:hypothetical protein
MKIIYCLIIFLLVLGCQDNQFETKSWHVKTREYKYTDSVAFPAVPYNQIMNVKVGDSFEMIEQKVGFKPVTYYIHPEYALLATEYRGTAYEVGFKYDKNDIVLDISYKPMKMNLE